MWCPRKLAFVFSLGVILVQMTCAEDPCECLNWKDVYEQNKVLCGEGLEFPFVPDKNYESIYFLPYALGFTYFEFCGSFFTRMNNNLCVNVEHHTYDATGKQAAQWCWVSKNCTELNGGEEVPTKTSIPEMDKWIVMRLLPDIVKLFIFPVAYNMVKHVFHTTTLKPRDVAWKLCTSGKDSLLSEMPVMDMLEMAKKMDSVVGYATKMAYPMARESDAVTPHWAQIESAVRKGDIQKLPAVVRKAVNDKIPIVIDVDPEGHTHQRILVGKEIYELNNTCDNTGCGAKQWPFRRARDMGEL